MTTTPPLDSNGAPVFESQLQAFLEGIDGNGVVPGQFNELAVTDGSGDLEVDVATGVAVYDGTASLHGSPTTLTHAGGNPSDDRWDIVVFDVNAGSPTIKQGTAAANPTPPSIGTDEVLLALVYIQSGATDFGPGDIYTWRVPVGGIAIADNGGQVLPSATGIDFADGLRAGSSGSAVTVNADLSPRLTFSSGNIDLATDGVGTGALDESITPTWTAQHQFDAGLDTRGDIVDLGTTIWDTSAGHIPRPQVDNELVTASISSNTTTSGEEVVFVDTSSSAITVTLASADVADGNRVIVADTASNASSNNITIDTGGGASIDGGSSITIDSDDGAAVVISDGTNWFTAGGGSGGGSGITNETIVADESGSVGNGNLGTIVATEVPNGGSIEITQGSLLLADGQPAPSGCDLILATLDGTGGGTSQTTLISGDGTTVYRDQMGTPLGSYSNSSGSAQTVALAVDNGNFNAGSGSSQDVLASGIGEVV
jgi:hypothetical protein